MLSDLRAPRELIFLMRIVAILGATKIASVAYFDLLNPSAPTAEEIAASEAEIRGLAEEGEARVFADFRRRAPGVLEAAERCHAGGDGAEASCRWAEIWTERYRAKSDDVLREPAAHPPETVDAAAAYRAALARLSD